MDRRSALKTLGALAAAPALPNVPGCDPEEVMIKVHVTRLYKMRGTDPEIPGHLMEIMEQYYEAEKAGPIGIVAVSEDK